MINNSAPGWIAALSLLSLIGAPAVVSGQFGGMGGPGGMGGNAFPATKSQSGQDRYRPTQVYTREDGPPVTEIRITGNHLISQGQVLQQLVTKPGRPLDSEALQDDVRKLVASGMFEDVQTFVNESDKGVIVTYQVRERPLIREIRFAGNDKVTERKLIKKAELKVGSPLTPYRIEEARRKIEEYYLEAGYSHARVTVADDPKAADGMVTFQIVEGPKQRIWKVEFIGNSDDIVTDARLRALIGSKSAIPWYFKSTLDMEKLEEDRQVLINYYRRLGFFMANVSRDLKFDEDGNWSTVVFVIDEGPRYRVRDIQIAGNAVYATPDLLGLLTLERGAFFDRTKMDADLKSLRDIYGSQGYMMADIQADIQFSDQPGQLELVYTIQEGDPFYVRDVKVTIRGDNPHTRHSAIMNYLSISPGDIVDIREIRDSKRRLGASQIVETNPALGAPPDIRVVPAEMDEYDTADRSPNNRAPQR